MYLNLEGYFVFNLITFSIIPQNFAQELITDRPDQTESAVTVPLHSLQIESGFAYESQMEEGLNTNNYSIAGTLFRYGLFERIEFRFGAGYLINKTDETRDGLSGFLLGTKINFLNEKQNMVDFGLLIHSAIPLGDETLNPQQFEPELIAALSKSLTDNLSVSINIGGFQDSSIEKIIYLYTTALGYSVSDKTGVFIEVFGNLSSSLIPVHLFDGGLTLLLSDNLQLDLSGGKEFTGDNSFWFLSGGISLRLPE